MKLEYFQESEDSGAWDKQNLADVLDVFEEIVAVNYEIRNCVRGTYAGFGDTGDDMILELQRLHENLGDAIKVLEAHVDDE